MRAGDFWLAVLGAASVFWMIMYIRTDDEFAGLVAMMHVVGVWTASAVRGER
jgi:hypothetical protein